MTSQTRFSPSPPLYSTAAPSRVNSGARPVTVSVTCSEPSAASAVFMMRLESFISWCSACNSVYVTCSPVVSMETGSATLCTVTSRSMGLSVHADTEPSLSTDCASILSTKSTLLSCGGRMESLEVSKSLITILPSSIFIPAGLSVPSTCTSFPSSPHLYSASPYFIVAPVGMSLILTLKVSEGSWLLGFMSRSI